MPKDDKAKHLADRMEKSKARVRESIAKRSEPHPIDAIIGDAKSASDIKAALLDHKAKYPKKDG